MSFEEDKFIVINRKHLELVGASYPAVPELLVRTLGVLEELHELLFGSSISGNKYYVCNQDEEYAPDVLRLILLNEGEG